jgi:hypothetical protein
MTPREGRSRLLRLGLLWLGVVALTFLGGALAGHALTGSGSPSGAEPGSVSRRPANDARVFVYGDSLVVQSTPYLASVGRALDVSVTVRAFGGIAPCDATPQMVRDLREQSPDLVLYAFSGNGFSDCMRDANGELATFDDVVARYHTDLERAAAITTQAGVPFLIASPPAAQDRTEEWRALDTVFRAIAADGQPQVQYTDAGVQIAPDGEFSATQRCLPFDLDLGNVPGSCGDQGESVGVRAPDGVHFCADPRAASLEATSCAAYSSGALRYAIALVTAAKLDLDFLAQLP